MLYKSAALALLLLASSQSRFQPRDLERLLPPPAWVESHASELGISPDDLDGLRRQLQGTRREINLLRRDIQGQRRELQEALAAEPLERTLVEERFAALLDAETRMKQLQLRARLDFLTALDDDQRAAVRQGAAELAGKRQAIRHRIEELRSLGRELERRGRDTDELRTGVRDLERMIRRGAVEEVLERCDDLRAAMRAELDR